MVWRGPDGAGSGGPRLGRVAFHSAAATDCAAEGDSCSKQPNLANASSLLLRLGLIPPIAVFLLEVGLAKPANDLFPSQAADTGCNQIN